MKFIIRRIKRAVRVLWFIAKNKRGSQLVEEGMLLGLSLVSMAIVATMATNMLNSIKSIYDSARNSLDQFLTKVLRDDFDKIWNFVFGKG